MRSIVVVAHNLRSAHNVGSLLRTAEGLGVTAVILTGYTPYPQVMQDDRMPWIYEKLDKRISKTALGAEKTLFWSQEDDIHQTLKRLVRQGYVLTALEQHKQAVSLSDFYPVLPRLAVLIGREVEGIESEVLDEMDFILEIPMQGKKESFNVVQAAAMALYHFRFY